MGEPMWQLGRIGLAFRSTQVRVKSDQVGSELSQATIKWLWLAATKVNNQAQPERGQGMD